MKNSSKIQDQKSKKEDPEQRTGKSRNDRTQGQNSVGPFNDTKGTHEVNRQGTGETSQLKTGRKTQQRQEEYKDTHDTRGREAIATK